MSMPPTEYVVSFRFSCAFFLMVQHFNIQHNMSMSMNFVRDYVENWAYTRQTTRYMFFTYCKKRTCVSCVCVYVPPWWDERSPYGILRNRWVSIYYTVQVLQYMYIEWVEWITLYKVNHHVDSYIVRSGTCCSVDAVFLGRKSKTCTMFIVDSSAYTHTYTYDSGAYIYYGECRIFTSCTHWFSVFTSRHTPVGMKHLNV